MDWVNCNDTCSANDAADADDYAGADYGGYVQPQYGRGELY